MNTKKKFLFAAHKILAKNFEMPDDGRKAKHKSACRRSLFMELASFADADGRGAWPSAKSLAKRLGQSERSIERYLADLTKLGFCKSRGKSKFGGSAIRDLFLPIPPDSKSSMPPDSTPIPSDSPSMPPANGGAMPPDTTSKKSAKALDESHIDGKKALGPAFYLPTNAPAHLPANTAVGAGSQESDKDVEWVRELFKERTGQILPSKDATSLFEGRLPEAVKGTVEDWLDRRDRGGMKNPAYFLKKEFPDYYNPSNQPSRDEYTKEEFAAIKARIDEENEAERSKLQEWIMQKEQEEAVALANSDSWF